MNDDEKWMKLAIREALLAESESEVPVGAVLVKDGKLIAKAHNQPISMHDATAHAEIQAIRKAGKKQKNYRLIGVTLYVTLEPCVMCLGALINARIERIVFGASDPKTGVCGSCANLNQEKIFNHKISIMGGILESENKEILQSFFKSRRKK
jgi:tRNA(adenine34) deaminase